MPQAHANFRALSGDYRLSGGTLEARNVRADVLGGKVSGELTLTHLSERPVAQVTAAVHDLSLEAVSAALDTKPLERAAISGIVQGRLRAPGREVGKMSSFVPTPPSPPRPRLDRGLESDQMSFLCRAICTWPMPLEVA